VRSYAKLVFGSGAVLSEIGLGLDLAANFSGHHSYLNATIGSTFEALRAGR
jgi:hypothetical protein